MGSLNKEVHSQADKMMLRLQDALGRLLTKTTGCLQDALGRRQRVLTRTTVRLQDTLGRRRSVHKTC